MSNNQFTKKHIHWFLYCFCAVASFFCNGTAAIAQSNLNAQSSTPSQANAIPPSIAASKLLKGSATAKAMKDVSIVSPPSAPASSSTAMQFFESKQYDKAADAFDIVLQSSAPARLTYYAALSNQYAGRLPRASTLFQFVVTTFPNTTEAKYSQTALTNGALSKPVAKAATTSSGSAEAASNESIEKLMERTKAQLPRAMQASFDTPEGKVALREMALTAMKNQQYSPSAQRSTSQSTSTSTSSLRRAATSNLDKPAEITSATSKLDNSFIQIAEKTQYSEQVRAQILQALSLIPEGVKSSLFSGGVRIVIDSDSSNMGSDPGFDAAGMFVPRENAVHVAERASTRVLVAYTREVILHEMGHAFDQGKSTSSSYTEVYQEECDKLNPNDTKKLSYYVTTDFGGRPAKECFAELFKIVCENGTEQGKTGGYAATDHVLVKNFPKTLEVVKGMLK